MNQSSEDRFSLFGSRSTSRTTNPPSSSSSSSSPVIPSASPVKRDRLPVPPVPPTPPGLSKAEFLDRVRRSNQACQQGEYALAVRLYSEALTADPQNCILFSNRSAAYLRLGEYSTALDDAIKARLINPKWPKKEGKQAGDCVCQGHLCLDDWGRASFNFLSLCERMDGSGVLEKRKEAQRLMAAPLICFRIRNGSQPDGSQLRLFTQKASETAQASPVIKKLLSNHTLQKILPTYVQKNSESRVFKYDPGPKMAC
ncbi:hypothetical protein NQZ68_010150 [Dissostichus eleginoides]|nr:hypothetical protein NQZ68_010150 [Dissostichus eleginoides]